MALALLAYAVLVAGQPAEATKSAGASSRNRLDEVVCKRTLRTGSLVATTRLCMTRREWNRSAETNQAEWGQLQGIQGSSREDQPTFINGSKPGS